MFQAVSGWGEARKGEDILFVFLFMFTPSRVGGGAFTVVWGGESPVWDFSRCHRLSPCPQESVGNILKDLRMSPG